MKNFLKSMLVMSGIVTVIFVAAILLVISGVIETGIIVSGINYIIGTEIVKYIIMGVITVYAVLAVIAMAFSSSVSNDVKGGVILPLKTGELHISSQTFESIVTNIAKKYAGLKTAKVNIKMKETGISVDLFVYVLQDTVIADITTKIQEDIKSTVLKQTTVAVENVNVRVKGVYTLNENKEA